MDVVTGRPGPSAVAPGGPVAPVVVHTGAAEGTRSVAGVLARLCVPGDVLLLAGDLGAGKTTFAQGFGRALGITERITSPTFTIVRQYPVDGAEPLPGAEAVRTLLHADVYRLDDLQEIVDLGLGELVEDGAVALVEWGDVAEPVLGDGSLRVRLDAGDGDDEEVRDITVDATGERWAERWPLLVASLAPWSESP